MKKLVFKGEDVKVKFAGNATQAEIFLPAVQNKSGSPHFSVMGLGQTKNH